MTAPALTLRWSLRDGALPDETCDGVVRVSQFADERGPYFAAVGEAFPWRGTSRVSAEMAARDWLRQTARGIDAEVMLTLPDGRAAHDAPFVGDPVPLTFAEDSIAEALARQRAAADAAVTEHALRVMGGEGEPHGWRNTAGAVERLRGAADASPAAPVRVGDVLLHDGLRWAVRSVAPRRVTLSRPGGASWELEPDALAAMLAAGEMRRA